MDTFKREFIDIMQAAFSENPANISEAFDWDKAVGLAKSHNIVPILYYGAVNSGFSKEQPHIQELYQLTLRSLMISTRQIYEIEQIEKTFAERNIEYMPLKGTILKGIYPKPEMRTMGDADILIKLEQYPEIQTIMEQLQFSFQYESDHELIWKKPSLFLELHKRIMTTYNKDFYDYFGSGWKIAKRIPNSTKYEMSAEDFYLFAFVHFTKHYRISGIGIKHLIDLWVYANAYPELDWAYVETELNKMHLLEFYGNINKTIDVWFRGGTETEVTDLITNVIFNSGQYGTAEMAIINRSLQKGTSSATKIKLTRMFKTVFLPYKAMKDKYTFLHKAPIFLPIMWIVRCFTVLFHKKTRVKHYLETINQIDSEQINKNEHALGMVGLDFESKE